MKQKHQQITESYSWRTRERGTLPEMLITGIWALITTFMLISIGDGHLGCKYFLLLPAQNRFVFSNNLAINSWLLFFVPLFFQKAFLLMFGGLHYLNTLSKRYFQKRNQQILCNCFLTHLKVNRESWGFPTLSSTITIEYIK